MIYDCFSAGRFEEAEFVATSVVKWMNSTPDLHFLAGLASHYLQKLPVALQHYFQCLRLNPFHDLVWTNVGAVYQALGKVEDAVVAYEHAVISSEKTGTSNLDAGLLNNFGSLLVIMHQEYEGLLYLQKALTLDQNMNNALVNLGSHYQDEGDLQFAEVHFKRALYSVKYAPRATFEIDINRTVLLSIRISLMTSPVSNNWSDMLQNRQTIENNLIHLLSSEAVRTDLDASLDRTHFYVQYHGLNDRFIQEMVSEVNHFALLPYFSSLFFLFGFILHRKAHFSLDINVKSTCRYIVDIFGKLSGNQMLRLSSSHPLICIKLLVE